MSATGLPAKWVPELKREALYLSNLEISCVNHLNKMPMFHPRLPAAFAVLAKIRNFLEAVRVACRGEYKLGFTEIVLKEPMYPDMGERPEFVASRRDERTRQASRWWG